MYLSLANKMRVQHIFNTLLCLAFLLLPSMPAICRDNPVASADAQVIVGKARFTVLTDRLIRMEWSGDGVFEDNATLAIVNRELPVPSFSKKKAGDGVIIKTKSLTLEYDGTGRFDEDNLSVSFMLNGKKVIWHPGMDDSANLLADRYRLRLKRHLILKTLSNEEVHYHIISYCSLGLPCRFNDLMLWGREG